MARGKRRTNLIPDEISAEPQVETLPKENLGAMDKLAEDLVDDIQKSAEKEENINTEEKTINEDENREDLKSNEYNIISKFEPGDRVKIKPGIGFDIMGHRIHNGIRNYAYTVRLQRDDNMVIIECLTIILTMKPEDIIKVDL